VTFSVAGHTAASEKVALERAMEMVADRVKASGSDIAFLGGIICYIVKNERYLQP
jgi:hypothetical protein